MRVFALKRIAYVEDLDKDLNVQKSVEYHGWILAKRKGSTSWESAICDIKEASPTDGIQVYGSATVESYREDHVDISMGLDHSNSIIPVVQNKFFYYNASLDYLVGFVEYVPRNYNPGDRAISEENVKRILWWIEDNSSKSGLINAKELGILK